ncbi:hypothetical protein LOTGIDRAFT_160675 [Lottia gigantea]|uniref:Gustatory receptor n=1 Tax=Lottia gigantea TaxID=225164 RepID=V4AL76_LOTGI|nr:hypothetical protein LOTGIDRAFT_160675 [Lottia gigantea]ESO95515.1 hypothetical protein LOTGIDRAFT_160675 [Lottia gigantea]
MKLLKEASQTFDGIAKNNDCKNAEHKSFEPCNNLKPILYSSAIFGLKCPLEFSKKTAVLCILYWLVLLSPAVFTAYKVVVCLAGADVVMDDSNLPLYILMLFGFGISPFCVSFGTFYIPGRFKKFEATLDEMTLDRRFEQSFDDVKKKSKVILGVAVSIFVAFLFPAMTSGPPFSNDYPCFTSPFNWTSPYMEIQNVVSSTYSLFLYCKRLSIYGFMYIVCSIVKKEFLKFDVEFRKMLESEPSKKNIKYFQRKYFLICRHLKEADCVLCPFVTLLLSVLIPTFCLLMRTVIYGNFSMNYMVAYIVHMPLLLIEIGYIVIQGTMIHSASKRCLEVIHDLDGNKMNVKSIALITLFADNVRHSEHGLSFMKLFLLNNSVIITIIGTILIGTIIIGTIIIGTIIIGTIISYTVVIMQLQF